MVRLRDGVYDLPAVRIRLVVVRELPREGRNAMLALFGGADDLLRYGYENHEFRSDGTGSLLHRIISQYLAEGLIMPDKLQEFIREETDRFLKELPPEKRMEGIAPQEVLKVIPPREVLKAIPPQERIEGMSAEELIAAMSPELLEAIRRTKPTE